MSNRHLARRASSTSTSHEGGAVPVELDTGVPRALIAEDEPLLAAALERELASAWPELAVIATVTNGVEAIGQIAALRPDVAFLDISMPGKSGIDVARACAALAAPPQIVFVTAYDEYALAAFDAAAIDYLLKPVDAARLARTVERLQQRLKAARPQALPGAADEATFQRLLTQLERLTREAGPGTGKADEGRAPPLRYLRASSGNDIRMVPVEEVLFFEAADKYVVVTTRNSELLIRTSLKDLCAQLDPSRFWQVHRGTVVNVDHVESATVSALGKMSLRLRGRSGGIAVSRQYSHL
ncbi:MAG TPA: LytTR family DNA-binding domain-containing protein, partial [Paraburkholderia sp.]|nr:LytTR family DNA-binding domain-containing protein [Paraburkholderia sp.]